MKMIMQYAFTSLLLVAVAAGLWSAKDWNSTTALFPEAVGIPMFVLLVAILIADIRKNRRQRGEGEEEGEKKFSEATLLTVRYLSWLVGFVVLVWAIGLAPSIPIYIFSYMRFQGKYGWLKSVLYAVAAGAFVYALFGYGFQMAWPEGALQTLWGT